jgi:hypothetical protein
MTDARRRRFNLCDTTMSIVGPRDGGTKRRSRWASYHRDVERVQDEIPHTIGSRRHLEMKSVDRQALLILLCLSRRCEGPIAPIRAPARADMTCSSRPTAIFLSCTFTSHNTAETRLLDSPARNRSAYVELFYDRNLYLLRYVEMPLGV